MLTFQLGGRHCVAEHVDLCRKRKLVELCTITLVAFYMHQSEALEDRIRSCHSRQNVRIVCIPSLRYKVTRFLTFVIALVLSTYRRNLQWMWISKNTVSSSRYTVTDARAAASIRIDIWQRYQPSSGLH